MTANHSQQRLSQSRPSSTKRRVLVAHGSDPFTASPRCLSAHLPMVANQLVSLLSEQDAASFLSSWLGSKLIVSSVCSGTDVCVDAIQCLAGGRQVRGGAQAFVRDIAGQPAMDRALCSPPPMVLYEDVYEFAKGYGYDVKSQRVAQLVPCDKQCIS